MNLTRLRRNEVEAQALLEETRALLRDAMKDLDDTRAETEALKEQTTMLEKRSQQYLAEMTKTRREHTALEQELSEMETEHDALKGEIDNFTTKRDLCKKEMETIEKDLIYLRFKASQEHDAYENTITTYATQQSEYKQEIDALRKEIHTLEVTKARLEAGIDMHAINMQADKDMIEAKWAEIREREEVIDRRAEDAKKLRHRLKKFCASKKIVFPIADK